MIAARTGNRDSRVWVARVAAKYWRTASTYQMDASIALYSGRLPASGKLFGNIPPSAKRAYVRRTFRATSGRPVARERPASATMVSRPQSANQWYPAITERAPGSSGRARCTMNWSAARMSWRIHPSAFSVAFGKADRYRSCTARLSVRIIVPAIHQHVQAQVCRTASAQPPVLHESSIRSRLHPDAFFNQRIGQRNLPDRCGAFQVECFDVQETVRRNGSAGPAIGGKWK